MCAKLRTVAASNTRDHARNLSYYSFLALQYNGVILHAHPVRGESHNQRNATREVAITSPPFHNEPHRSHALCVKVELVTTSTSWSQHHFVAATNEPHRSHALCVKVELVTTSTILLMAQ